ncbi:hypothetical protein BDA99DRAFT_120331 [Phascolomyces articulosus]|uniref:Uncharacterized protein n=1 Tax=Phascolomyces articulosus TaxID=60185 RepID=A0AAD5KAP3_9FUNG|nr:hypothetical protein BDA99DRAFT_120331 [Phascolomyces articulosus]
MKIQEFIYMGTSDSRLCTTLYTSQQQTSSAGIKTIKLKFWSMDLGTTMDDEPISAVFRRCHTTLETLELDMGTLLASRYKCLDILASLGAPQLRNLVLNLHDDTIDGETVTRFITASPALQLVDIQGSGFWTPELFDALGSLTELEKLSIYQTHYDDDDDDCADIGDDVDTPPHIKEEKPGIIQNGHWLAPVLVCKHSKLVEFTYRHNNSNEDTAFLLDLAPSLAQSTIQKLHLQDISIQNGDVLSVILEHLARSQTLHTLRVWLPFDIMEKDIIAFASIENLAYLDIWDTHGAVTKEMMYNVFRHLEKRDRFIFIRGDDPDSDHTVKGYTHGTSLQPLFKKKSSGRITDQEENFIIEEYLGSD